MSFHDGMAAINLDMPTRVPRTEYSAGFHWPLIKAVTGIDVSEASDQQLMEKARREFEKAWNYDFAWSVLIFSQEFGEVRTSMGHASYREDGSDFTESGGSPFTDPQQVLDFDPFDALGRKDHATLVKRFEEHYRQAVKASPDMVNMTGTYITLVSGLIDLFGWDMLLLAAGTDMEAFGKMADRYAAWMQQYFNALADADVPVVMVHDDIVWTSGPFISPAWYREYVFPNYKKYFAPLIESGKKIAYTSDGNYSMFIDDIVACGANGFIMEPCTDMQYVADKYGKTHFFVGNADTRILLSGTKEQIRREVQRCMNIGKNCPGFFLAVGNHIPPNTPVESAIYYNEVYEELSIR